MSNIAVYGGGSWGTALACQIARKNGKCILFVRDKNIISNINNNRLNNKYLGNNLLEKDITPTDDVEQLKTQEIIIIVLPSKEIKELVELFRKIKIPADVILLIATKGLIADPAMMMSDYIKQILPNPIAFLAGPNFAEEVVSNLQTHTTVGADDIDLAKQLTKIIASENFIISPCDDIISIQIAGSVKNIIAIKSGFNQFMFEQNIIGENARAALVAGGLQEISKIAKFFGGKAESLAEMGIVGDLVLSCSSLKSRNAKFGYELAKAEDKKSFIQNYNILVEGIEQARLIKEWIERFNFDLPLISSTIKMLEL